MRIATGVSAFVALVLSVAAADAQVVRQLQTSSSRGDSIGQAVNSAGVVAGAGPSGPSIWRPGAYGLEFLPLPAGNTGGYGNSIASSGAIAGYVQPQDGSTATATIWTAPTPGSAYSAATLPSPSGSTLTDAYSINASGSIGGYRETATGHTNAVVWDPINSAYTATLLPGLPGWGDTAATATNDNGDLAGYSFAALGGPRGAVWQKTPTGYVPKDVIAGADDVVITAINNFGTGAGVVNGDQAAVMVYFEGDYYAGELNVPFGSSDSAANAVNNADGLAGYLKDPTTAQTGPEAALWLPGEDEWELVNLDDWLNKTDPALGARWVLEEAYGLSDNWIVTGHGMFDPDGAGPIPFVGRGFVMDVSSLVPEPSGVFALISGPLLILRRRRRRRS
jgi:hypothetical protein